MTATATYSATMPELRGDPAPSSFYSSYGGPVHMSPRVGGSLQSGLVIPPPVSHSSQRPRSEQANIDHHQPYTYPRYSHDEPEPYNSHVPPAGLPSQQGYQNNLKRSFSQTEQTQGQELVQDLRDDGSRVTANHDHKLLAFKRSQDKQTITDQHGRLHQLELSAQLHGMFFLSEMPSAAGDGSVLQPELTCYRRNLFQISGSLITPRGQMSVITESGESVLVNSMEVAVSAIESVDGNPVRLIVIPWKTPPPNSPEVNQTPDQEPPTLPLIPFQEDGSESDGEYAVYPIGWRRLQFRIATANNGRRKELQQHFVLHLKVYATLANGSKVVLTESTTSPIVVRGRSPRNFQARKEIPLLGSSAGSRGQALVETGLGVVAGALNIKPHEPKPRNSIDGLQLPRTSFSYAPGQRPGPPMNAVRSNSYPNWNTPGPLPQLQSSGPSPYPPTTLQSDIYPKVGMSSGPNYTTESSEMPIPTTLPSSVPMTMMPDDQQSMRSQYNYVPSSTAPRQMPSSVPPPSDSASSVPRYVEEGRPAKMARTGGHQSVHSSGSHGNSEGGSEYRYGSYTPVNTAGSDMSQQNYSSATTSPLEPAPPRNVYPPSQQQQQSWTTSAPEQSSTLAYAGPDSRSYASPYDQYNKSRTDESTPLKSEGQQYASNYNSTPHRGSVDAISNYSWSNS